MAQKKPVHAKSVSRKTDALEKPRTSAQSRKATAKKAATVAREPRSTDRKRPVAPDTPPDTGHKTSKTPRASHSKTIKQSAPKGSQVKSARKSPQQAIETQPMVKPALASIKASNLKASNLKASNLKASNLKVSKEKLLPATSIPKAAQPSMPPKSPAPIPAPLRREPTVVFKRPERPMFKAGMMTQSPPTPKALAERDAEIRMHAVVQKKPVNQRHGFKTNEFVVYPAHGVGRIVGIEEQEIAGVSLELFVILIEKEKLTLRVPIGKLQSVGMRKLSELGVVNKALELLKGRARVKRTMWSRRAQEYVAKIHSGDLLAIAEVVRDLYRSEAQPEQSYSERQLYEDALDRMAREVAAVEKIDERGAVQRITEVLSKSARGRRVAAGEEEAESGVKAA